MCTPWNHTPQGSGGNLTETQQDPAHLCSKPYQVPSWPCVLSGGFLLTSCYLLPHPLPKMNSSPAETRGPPNIQLCLGTCAPSRTLRTRGTHNREMLKVAQLCLGGCWGLGSGVPAFWLLGPLGPKHAGGVQSAEREQRGPAGHSRGGLEGERVPPTPRWPHYPF